MGKHLFEFKRRRRVFYQRWENSVSMLKEYQRDLERAEARLAELREEIPKLRKKITQPKGMIEFSRLECEREFGGERDLKKERIARLKDGLETLTHELSRIDLADADQRVRNQIKRSKKKKKKRK